MVEQLEYKRKDVDRIFDKYKDTVFRLAYAYTKNRADADDVFQEVFLRYFKANPEFKDHNHEKAWFLRVTINCSKKLLTSSWFKRTVPMDENISFNLEEKSKMFYAVMALPKKYSVVVHLYYYEDYSIKEISDITGLKETTIQSQLMRGRNMLKEALKGEDENE